jgi:hypothetical protein
MAKFAKTITDDDLEPLPPTPAPAPVTPPPVVTPTPTAAPIIPTATASVTPPVTGQAQVIQAEAQAAIDQKVADAQLAKQDEHWAKSYWRPAMGWLYMLICLVDFVIFPAISMFIPIVTKLPYVAWQSLSLSNGGLIHMAFGAILGVAAYGRTQEKVASKQ